MYVLILEIHKGKKDILVTYCVETCGPNTMNCYFYVIDQSCKNFPSQLWQVYSWTLVNAFQEPNFYFTLPKIGQINWWWWHHLFCFFILRHYCHPENAQFPFFPESKIFGKVSFLISYTLNSIARLKKKKKKKHLLSMRQMEHKRANYTKSRHVWCNVT